MPKLTLKGHQINYYVNGKGAPIVFIHGFCEDSSMWENFITPFSKNKIIRIDLPGFGASDVIENLSIELAADIIKEVLDDLEIKKCIMIGHSMGGYISLAFAKKYSTFLNGLGIFHSHPYADTEEKKEGRKKSIEFIKKNSHIHYVKQLVPALFPSKFAGSNNFLVNKMIHQASSFSANGIINGLQLMLNRPDQSEVLNNIKCPVLFIVGLDDELVPLEKSLEQTALPDVAHIHVLKGIGHMGMFESPKATQKMVKQFVAFCHKFQNTPIQKTVAI